MKMKNREVLELFESSRHHNMEWRLSEELFGLYCLSNVSDRPGTSILTMGLSLRG